MSDTIRTFVRVQKISIHYKNKFRFISQIEMQHIAKTVFKSLVIKSDMIQR